VAYDVCHCLAQCPRPVIGAAHDCAVMGIR
jgi:hypothetical protein